MANSYYGNMYISLLRASLGTLFSQWISIFPKENELIFLGKMKIPRENGSFFQTSLRKDNAWCDMFYD
jgi:hypothetical protein